MKTLNALGLAQYLSLINVTIYLIIINIIGILVMYIDKQKARYGRWRIPEKTLLIVSGLGGFVGVLIGMYVFRHKTKKLKFVLGVPTIMISEIIIITYFLLKY